MGELFLLEQEVDGPTLQAAVRRATLALSFVPVFMGSAYKNKVSRFWGSIAPQKSICDGARRWRCTKITLTRARLQSAALRPLRQDTLRNCQSALQHVSGSVTLCCMVSIIALHPCPLLFLQGVQLLLDGVESYLPCPLDVESSALDAARNEEPVRLAKTRNGVHLSYFMPSLHLIRGVQPCALAASVCPVEICDPGPAT